jgi:hypothetical protein
MNTLNFICLLLLTLLLPALVLASSVELIYTSDELEEMGIRLGPSDGQPE